MLQAGGGSWRRRFERRRSQATAYSAGSRLSEVRRRAGARVSQAGSGFLSHDRTSPVSSKASPASIGKPRNDEASKSRKAIILIPYVHDTRRGYSVNRVEASTDLFGSRTSWTWTRGFPAMSALH